jgi:arylsulfatase A-like enzyme
MRVIARRRELNRFNRMSNSIMPSYIAAFPPILARCLFVSLCTTVSLQSLSMFASSRANEPARKPNLVVVLADDQGWGDLSVHGNTNLSTPNIDSLARDGALFDRFFVCPVCSPTRAEWLTGRYHPRGGVSSTSTGGERLNLGERTIAEVFKQAGYATGAFGKWHNGSQWPYHPNARGFDEYYGFTSGHWGDYFSPPLEHNGQPVRGAGFLADDLTDHALAFIEAKRVQPFFCYLPLNTPHSPMQVPDRFFAKFQNADLKLRYDGTQGEDLTFTRAALAMCENIDWNVGRVLAKLAELKLADDTIVVYFSDNGPNSWRWNDGMKGRKASTDEGGVRSPLLIRWPGHISAGTRVAQISAAIDLLPTLADLAGVPLAPAADKPLDGRSVAPLLLAGKAKDSRGNNRADWPDRMIFSHWNGAVSVRTQNYRLDQRGNLYDMTADPGQSLNVAADHPEITKQLTTAVADWKRDLLPGLAKDERPFTVGYKEFPLTPLPARDGVPHGNIKRSARAPNCSYFKEWRDTQDRMTWKIEVATAGKYEATIYYACPAADVSSTIELSLGDRRIEAVVAEAHDPPAVGAEHDRTPREGESLMKDFKPMRLGEIDLPAGRGELTLRALKVAGKQVAEVRAVTLKLMK